MWYFQRDDAYLRNQWSNYTNWPYNYQPYDLIIPIGSDIATLALPCTQSDYTPAVNPLGSDGTTVDASSNIYITGVYNAGNQKEIMQYWALLLDGKYRENEFEAEVFDYVEKYARCEGNSQQGLYVYSFGLHTDPFNFQPSGAMNMSKFKNIEFEFSTYQPPLDPSAQVFNICNPDNPGQIIGVNKPTWRIYDYNYNMNVFEERYNILTFVSGNAGLLYAR
jgi:hypothetical protein